MDKLLRTQDKSCVCILKVHQQSEILHKLHKSFSKENIYVRSKHKSSLKLQE